MLSAILECGFLIMQSLLEVGNVLLECGRLICEALVEGIDRNGNEPDQCQRMLLLAGEN